MKSCWEIEIMKYISDIPDIQHSQYFDRKMFRECCPEDYIMNFKDKSGDWNETYIGRYLNKMIAWGLVKKRGQNKYILLQDVIADFSGGD